MFMVNAQLKVAGEVKASPERRIQLTPISIKMLR
jgi:hypothetical protein